MCGQKMSETNSIHRSVALELPDQYKTAIKVSKMMPVGNIAEQAFTALYPEQIYQAFEGSTDNSWCAFDPRISWLIDLIQQNRDEKILIIAAQAQTALAIEEALRTREAIKAAVFHEYRVIINVSFLTVM